MAFSSARIHDKAGEALEVAAVVCGARAVATQLRPDLDAVLAVWICQRIRKHHNLPPAEVVFLPSSTTTADPGVLAVGIGPGRGIQRFGYGRALRKSSIQGSAAMALFRALPEPDRAALEIMVLAISDEKETGESPHVVNLKESLFPDRSSRWDRLDIRNPLIETTMWSAFKYYSMAVSDDYKVLDTWGTVFDGILAAGLKQREANRASQQATLKFNGQLAILPHGAPQQTTKVAFKNGALVVMFSSYLGGDNWTLGLVKRTGDEARMVDFYDFQGLLKKYVPDIFVHQGGFLAGWTVKAPLVCSASEFKDRQSALELAVNELMRVALQTKG